MSAPGISLRLEQVGGPPLAQSTLALQRKIILGRGTDAEFVLPDPQVSRRHCLIDVQGERALVQDLDSRVGTLLNDVKLPAGQLVELHPHDRLRIGPWRFRVRSAFDVSAMLSSAQPGLNTMAGKTLIGTPILAAERRLELLVEFAAATANAPDPKALAALTLDYALRGSAASSGVMFAPASFDEFPVLARLGDAQLPAVAEAFGATIKGGVVQVDLQDAGLPCVALALRVDGEPVSFLLVSFATPAARAKSEASEFLHALSRMSALAWAQLERKAVLIRLDRLNADLERAHETQARLLPPVSGTLTGLQYAYHLLPGRAVAGDLLDVFALDANRTGIVFGDVSGAGFGAAMLMASVQAYLHAELLETGDPALAANRANRYAARVGGGRFVTAWIAVFDARSQQLQVVDAGHGMAWWLSATQAIAVELRGGIPLGVDAETSYQAETLSANGQLVLLSDGVTEHRAAQENGGCFADALSTHLLALTALQLSQKPNQLFEALRSFGGRLPDDDATALFLGFGSAAP